MTQIRDTLADEGNKRLTTKRHRGIRYAIIVATAIFANRSIRRCRPYEENERWSALLSPSVEATRDRRICITLKGGWSYRRYVQSESSPGKKYAFGFYLRKLNYPAIFGSYPPASMISSLIFYISIDYECHWLHSTIENFSFIFPFRDVLVKSLHTALKKLEVFSFLKLLAKLLHQVSFWILR